MTSICTKTWILKDGRTVFCEGVKYKHHNDNPLAIKGDKGIVMWMNTNNYKKYFGYEK